MSSLAAWSLMPDPSSPARQDRVASHFHLAAHAVAPLGASLDRAVTIRTAADVEGHHSLQVRAQLSCFARGCLSCLGLVVVCVVVCRSCR